MVGDKLIPGATFVIGKFDGLHLGHQELVRRAAAFSNDLWALSFHPYPGELFGHNSRYERLHTVRERVEWIKGLGGKGLVSIRFNRDLVKLSPYQFVDQILLKKLQVARVVVGEDFRFGENRGGDVQSLRELGAKVGIEVVSVEKVGVGGILKIGSGELRDAVRRAALDQIPALVGAHYRIDGRVVRGHGIGRKIGYPTLNLHRALPLLLPDGVYAVRCSAGAGDSESDLFSLRAVANLGVRPTFGGSKRGLEVHLLDGHSTLGNRVRLEFVKRLRGEQRFANAKELARQIALDCEAAHRALS